MNKISFTLSIIFIVIFVACNKKPAAVSVEDMTAIEQSRNAAEAVRNDMPFSPYIKYNGKMPNEMDIWRDTTFKKRLASLLKNEGAVKLLVRNFTAESPIVVDNNLVFMCGRQSLSDTKEAAAIAIETTRDVMFASILTKGEVTSFADVIGVEQPFLLRDWVEKVQERKFPDAVAHKVKPIAKPGAAMNAPTLAVRDSTAKSKKNNPKTDVATITDAGTPVIDNTPKARPFTIEPEPSSVEPANEPVAPAPNREPNPTPENDGFN
jgi:hypothetical protein